MKKEKLIVRLTAIIMAATIPVALAGCNKCNKEESEESNLIVQDVVDYNIKIVDDGFIVVNGEIHKGDLINMIRDGGYAEPVLGYRIECDCGQTIVCADGFYAYETKPSEELYETICEECINQP